MSSTESSTEQELVEKLRDLGLNTYQAKVYLALLSHNPATGYEISKESGVPQARAYDTLKELEKQKMVVALPGKPVTYLPISPEMVLDRWERKTQSTLDYLRDALPSLGSETIEPAINVRGEAAVERHIAELIHHARKNIFMEVWKRDGEKFSEQLKQAQQQGVELRLVGYAGFTLDFVDVYQHGNSESLSKVLGGRWVLVSIDDAEGLVCWFPEEDGAPVQAVYTRNPGLVLLIKEMVVHDIFLLDVESNCREAIEAVYGKNLFKLRHKIFGDGLAIGGH